MHWKPILHEEVTVRVHAEPDLIPVEGNAVVSGDEAYDREIEQSIQSRLQQDDVWAWAMVTVTISWGPFSASKHLGCCSYMDEEDFRQPGGYFDDMVNQALEEFNVTVFEAYQQLKERDLAA